MTIFNSNSKVHIDHMNLYFNKTTQEAKIVVTYIEDNNSAIIEHNITAPLMLASFPNIKIYNNNDHIFYGESVSVDFGFGDLYNASYASKVLKTKTKKMTIAEIEKALGHKVEIVGEE